MTDILFWDNCFRRLKPTHCLIRRRSFFICWKYAHHFRRCVRWRWSICIEWRQTDTHVNAINSTNVTAGIFTPVQVVLAFTVTAINCYCKQQLTSMQHNPYTTHQIKTSTSTDSSSKYSKLKSPKKTWPNKLSTHTYGRHVQFFLLYFCAQHQSQTVSIQFCIILSILLHFMYHISPIYNVINPYLCSISIRISASNPWDLKLSTTLLVIYKQTSDCKTGYGMWCKFYLDRQRIRSISASSWSYSCTRYTLQWPQVVSRRM